MDQLADEYANQPVVFLEYDIDNLVGYRYNRWWSSYDSTDSAILPLVMVDSGQQISSGSVDFYNVYKLMVETELNRPAEAELQASACREANKVKFSINLKNLSTATLNFFTNGAVVHGIVYEDADDGVTNRIVRGAGYDYILTGLAPGSSANYLLETNELIGINWEKLHYIALVDFRPGGNSGPFDILQATEAELISYSISPNPLMFLIDMTDPSTPTSTVSLAGHNSLNWSVTEEIDSLTISPSSGSFPATPSVSIDKSKLILGWQPEGALLFDISSEEGVHFEENLEVKAFYGAVKKAYLPLLTREQ